MYEAPVRELLGKAALSSHAINQTMGCRELPSGPDPSTHARIALDRKAAPDRLVRDRGATALTEAVSRLDHHEATARIVETPDVTADNARAYLDALPRLWDDTDDGGRAALAQAVFANLDVLGVQQVEVRLTPAAEAHGFAALFAAGPVGCAGSNFGRGERDRASSTHVRPRPSLTLVNRTRRASEIPLAVAKTA